MDKGGNVHIEFVTAPIAVTEENLSRFAKIIGDIPAVEPPNEGTTHRQFTADLEGVIALVRQYDGQDPFPNIDDFRE
jgi:hypothetical protein